MKNPVTQFKSLISKRFPEARISVDEPAARSGSHWIDIKQGQLECTIEFRPGLGFGLFERAAGFGERPSEIYRTPELAARRVEQRMTSLRPKETQMGLKEVRELYGKSQAVLAKKAGVKQPAISRFEKRGEVKLSTLASAIKALGGQIEIRARFPDADLPISLTSKTS